MKRDPNPLRAYFDDNRGRLVHKWLHYFDIYDRHFAPFRNQAITIVEFGVFHGGSLQMWRQYFGKKARIIGVDIDPRCKSLEEKGIEILIGDQEDRDFLRDLRTRIDPIHLIIDDGGHTMGQQIATFEEMYPALQPGGIFLVEDLHTSYWPEFGGGYLKPGTFIEYAKGLVDTMHAWHIPPDGGDVDREHTPTLKAMHFYDSVIVFEKGVVSAPEHHKTGTPVFPE